MLPDDVLDLIPDDLDLLPDNVHESIPDVLGLLPDDVLDSISDDLDLLQDDALDLLPDDALPFGVHVAATLWAVEGLCKVFRVLQRA